MLKSMIGDVVQVSTKPKLSTDSPSMLKKPEVALPSGTLKRSSRFNHIKVYIIEHVFD